MRSDGINLTLLVSFSTFPNVSAWTPRSPEPWASLNSPGTALTEIVDIIPDRITDEDLQRIAVPVSYSGYGEEVVTFPERRPYATNLLVATLKGFLADAFVQLTEISRKRGKGYDWRRGLLFTMFGLLYAGVVEWIIYVDIFSFLCPNMLRFANESWEQKLLDRRGQFDVVKQILIDNFIHYTFVYYPIFYTLKEIVQGPAGFDISVQTVGHGLRRYKHNMGTDLCRIWIVNIPGDVLIYTIPMWLRMPVNHAVGFVWTMGLSYFRGEPPADEESSSTKYMPRLSEDVAGVERQQQDSLESPAVPSPEST